MANYDSFATGMFDDRSSAEIAVRRLHELGYDDSEIGVMMSDGTRARDFAADTGSSVAEGAAKGAMIGGGLGAIIAALTATGSVFAIAGTAGAAAPVVAGPLAAALAGLGAGGVTGGLIGALSRAGVPENAAKAYEDRLNQGGILLAVRPRTEDIDELRRFLMIEDEPAQLR